MHIYVCVLVYINYAINRFLAILHIFPSLRFLTPSVLHEMTSNLPTTSSAKKYLSLHEHEIFLIFFPYFHQVDVYNFPFTLLIPIIFCISFTESIPFALETCKCSHLHLK